MRIFVAVKLTESLRLEVAVVQQTLARQGVLRIRWVDSAAIHLTLRFCGEISRETADCLARAFAPGPPYARFDLRIGGLGRFPPRGAPRVLFLEVEDEGRLGPLASWVEGRVVAAGIPPEPRTFHPHLTLGRFRPGSGSPAPELLAASFARNVGKLPVENLVIFRSHLDSGAPRHEELHRFPLAGVAP